MQQSFTSPQVNGYVGAAPFKKKEARTWTHFTVVFRSTGSQFCARPLNHNFRCVLQEGLRSIFPSGDQGRHFVLLETAAGDELKQIGQV
jgi:hypothetical protein